MNEAAPKYIKNEEKKTVTSLYSPIIWLLDKEYYSLPGQQESGRQN